MRRAVATSSGRLDLVGRDFVRGGAFGRAVRRFVPVAIGVAVVAALGIAALRIDLIRVRYGLADAVRQERALLEERRVMLGQVRELRDPQRLAQLAQERGFVRPVRIRTLAPAPPGSAQP